ncbi:hypothetical protein ACU610_13475 [Geodermatophilus sp. URMC 61]|uniref:hypothetical protein n=1 Tax=Geodermatophilus sp. URMC 61 TaxID=3423411 RepID=UPI00406BFDB9
MDRTTRRRTLTLVAGIGLAGLVAGTSAAYAQGGPAATATAPAAAQDGHAHGTTSDSSAPAGASAAATGSAAPAATADVCAESDLPAHTGFQVGPACVSTPFGEVGAAEDNPQLLITDAPEEVAVGQAFTLQVSTRNLVRDRFLPAAEGGYYVEPSTLTEDGLVRGHFHTACRVLGDTDTAPQPERQAVFVATEDGGGGARPDTVTVRIPGLPAAGEAQCATWAGDGSHRMPMMVFANQVPAFDAVRITVRGAGAGAAESAEESEQAPAAEAEEPATQPEVPATGTGEATGTEEATEPTGSAAPQRADVEDAAADVTGSGTRSRDEEDTGADD